MPSSANYYGDLMADPWLMGIQHHQYYQPYSYQPQPIDSLYPQQQNQNNGISPSNALQAYKNYRQLSNLWTPAAGGSLYVGAPAGSAAYGPLAAESAIPAPAAAGAGPASLNIAAPAGSSSALTADSALAGGSSAAPGGGLGAAGMVGGGLMGLWGLAYLWTLKKAQEGHAETAAHIHALGLDTPEGRAAYNAPLEQKYQSIYGQ